MKQTVSSIHRPIHARVDIPGSKSMTNRALLLAALSDGVCQITELLLSDDTRAFIDALQSLGVAVQLDESTRSCIIGGCNGKFPKQQASVWCDSAGTVGRFLLAACASSEGEYFFDGSLQLRSRPIQPLLALLCAQGGCVTPVNAKEMPFTMHGVDGLAGGEMHVDGAQTGQFTSSLLMVAPFAKTQISIKTKNLVSRPYVNMTTAMMAEFGVVVHRMHQSLFSVPVPQRYKARDYVIEPDLTTASYFFAAAAITGGQVTVQAFDRKGSKQGDAVFLTILEKMGCRIIDNRQGLSVKAPMELRGVSVDMRDCSDTFMTLAAVAPFAKTSTSITNIGHTRLQESDRIKAMREGLEKMQVRVEEGDDWLRIHPSKPQGALINTHGDHRIAMAFSIMGLRVSNTQIEGAECVSKTCPDFYKMLQSICE